MKKILLLLLFISCIFAQNTDKQSVVRSANEALINSYEETLELFRAKIISGSITETAPVFDRYTTVDSFFVAAAIDTVTTSWKTMGSVIDMRGYTQLNVYVSIDRGASADIRLRAYGMINDSTGVYPFVIETISSTDVKVDAEYIEFNTDADQYAILKIQTDGVPYIRLQYQAGTVSAEPAKFTSVYINKIWK